MYKNKSSSQNRIRRKDMKKRKLKKFVLPTLYLMILGIMACSITFLSKNLLENKVQNDERYNYTMSVFNDDDKDTTNQEVEASNVKVSAPFTSDKVTISKEFYNKEATGEAQEKALIYYEGTYMPNTGVLYESDEAFDVVAIMDGTVKDIKQDEILGTVMTIENSSKLTTIYYTLGETKVNIGDTVKKDQIIAQSGSSKLETSKTNTLLFETYLNGILTDPATVLEKNISDLN